MLLKDSGGGSFEQPPIGTHVARCVKLIDIGTQKGEYQGKATFKHQIIVGWELPNELMTEGEYAGKPFTVSKFYTASLSEKANLRKDLANWRGRDFTEQELAGFDSKNIIGKPCMVSITLNEKGNARVTGVMALPKGTSVPEQITPTLYLSLDRGEFAQAVFDSLSEKMQNMIAVSPEFQELKKPAGSFDDMQDSNLDSDIPF